MCFAQVLMLWKKAALLVMMVEISAAFRQHQFQIMNQTFFILKTLISIFMAVAGLAVNKYERKRRK